MEDWKKKAGRGGCPFGNEGHACSPPQAFSYSKPLECPSRRRLQACHALFLSAARLNLTADREEALSAEGPASPPRRAGETKRDQERDQGETSRS